MKKIFYAVLVVMMVTMFGCSQNTSGNLEQSNDKTQIKRKQTVLTKMI